MAIGDIRTVTGMFKSDIACNAIPAISASNQISGMPISASNINQEVVDGIGKCP